MDKKSKKYTVSIWTMIIAAAMAVAYTVANVSAQLPAGMVSYWKFDEGNGQTASNSVDANHGTIYGATWITGIVDGALNFDGVDDYVEIPDHTNSNLDLTTHFTLEAWIYPTSYAWANNIITKWGPANSTEQRSYVLNLINGRSAIWISTDGTHQEGTTVFYVTGSTILSLNKWYHIVGIFDGNHLKVYVNGILDGYMAWSGTIFNGNAPLRIGADGWRNYPFNGIIDEVAIYNKALTSEEIQQHYQNGLKGLSYVGAPFAAFTLTKAEIKFSTLSSIDDSFEVIGEFTLGQNSDGIDPVNEDVVLQVGTSFVSIPVGSFLAVGSTFEFQGIIGGVDVLMTIEKITLGAFKFKVQAKRVDLTGTSNPVDIILRIGDDTGTASVRLGGVLEHEVTTVEIDIKPGSFPNSINLSSAGVIPVAILSSSAFDTTTVNPDTVSLAGASTTTLNF